MAHRTSEILKKQSTPPFIGLLTNGRFVLLHRDLRPSGSIEDSLLHSQARWRKLRFQISRARSETALRPHRLIPK
jgi:hypothetical protein